MTYEGHQIRCRKVACNDRGEYWLNPKRRCNCSRRKRKSNATLKDQIIDRIVKPLQPRDTFKCRTCGAALGWCEPDICDKCRDCGEDTKQLDWLLDMISASSTPTVIELFGKKKARRDRFTREDVIAAMKESA